MKITQDILDNGKWLSEEIFRWKNPKYGNCNLRKIVCKQCGEECFIHPKKTEGCCSKRCHFDSMIGQEVSDHVKEVTSKTHKGRIKSKEEIEKSRLNRIGTHIVDLTGKKFGKLLVLKMDISRDKNNHVQWICKCDCGNVILANSGSLQSGSKKSCGCLKRESGIKAGKSTAKRAVQLGFADYDTYAHRLAAGGEVVRRGTEESMVVEVKCRYCGKYFAPTTGMVYRRCYFIEGKNEQEFGLYCSEGCKKACPIFGKTEIEVLNSTKIKESLNREAQPELRKIVFERDGYACQICGNTEILHCHHIEGVEQNPIESADVDICITLCKKCHKKVHKEKGCRYYDLRKCPEIEDSIRMVI